jgi:hypothetical protein
VQEQLTEEEIDTVSGACPGSCFPMPWDPWYPFPPTLPWDYA